MKLDEVRNTIIEGDCIEVMKTLPDNSIDTIITDPPYNLGFMGKKWDTIENYQEWTRKWAKEALRVAKPGATLLSFGGTRTWHRLACGLEDAGWIIRDTLMWIYSVGFPKSLNIGKAVDKKLGNKRIKIGYQQRGNSVNTDFMSGGNDITKGNTEWEGYGTALKPAWEPIIMAMKPLDGTYVENALKWGVAGLNIDGGRIPTEDNLLRPYSKSGFWKSSKLTKDDVGGSVNGRFPANLLLDEEAAKMLDQQSGISGGKFRKGSIRHHSIWNSTKGRGIKCNAPDNYGDAGGASRFFYVAKASRRERNIGGVSNNHPTVKPLKLMEYLCILTKTPTGGIVLDPFTGSGTTCMAAKAVGRDYIGIEKEKEYCEIARLRIKAIKKQLL